MAIAKDAYNGFATLGRIQSTIGLVIVSIICSIIFIIGITLLVFSIKGKNKYSQSITATLTNVNCSTTPSPINPPDLNRKNIPPPPPPPPTTICNVTATYIINGKTYAININWPGAVNNQTVTLLYNPSNPSDAVQKVIPIWIGIIIICIALVFFLLAYFMYWVSMRYKPVAAAEGVGTVGSIFGNLFNNN